MNTITLDKFGGDLAGQIYCARKDQCDPNLSGYYAICSFVNMGHSSDFPTREGSKLLIHHD